MAAVKSIIFHGADNMMRKGMMKAMHGAMQAMMHMKRKGDSLKIVMDDGSVVDYVYTHYAETADGYKVDLAPGVES